MNQVEELISYFGGRVKLAKALGISLTAVSKWKTAIPLGRAYQIQVITQGKFKAKDLTNTRDKCNG